MGPVRLERLLGLTRPVRLTPQAERRALRVVRRLVQAVQRVVLVLAVEQTPRLVRAVEQVRRVVLAAGQVPRVVRRVRLVGLVRVQPLAV